MILHETFIQKPYFLSLLAPYRFMFPIASLTSCFNRKLVKVKRIMGNVVKTNGREDFLTGMSWKIGMSLKNLNCEQLMQVKDITE